MAQHAPLIQDALMSRNIEIKARIDDLEPLASKLAAVADQGPIEITQDDTFFSCAAGRLKLRSFSPDEGGLIFYRRDDRPGPKESFYVRSPTRDPGSLREALTLAYGKAGRVVKERTVYIVGRVRVHLDRVVGLGNFMELEVVLREHEALDTGVQEANKLMKELGIQPPQLISGAYVDLLSPHERPAAQVKASQGSGGTPSPAA